MADYISQKCPDCKEWVWALPQDMESEMRKHRARHAAAGKASS